MLTIQVFEDFAEADKVRYEEECRAAGVELKKPKEKKEKTEKKEKKRKADGETDCGEGGEGKPTVRGSVVPARQACFYKLLL